jgi:opacity protein-like surface antigen
MKKNTIIIFAALLSACMMSPGTAGAQVVQKGNILVDAYYGGPNLWKNILKTFFVESNSTNVQVGGFGPVGGRFEYMASDKIGVGLDVNYTTVGISWTGADSSSSTVYNYDLASKRTRAMARINIHFGGSDSFDGYFGVGAGYNSVKYVLTSNDPGVGGSTPGLNPLAFRLALGGHYYFTPNIGIGMELGAFGGAILEGGLAVKF